MIKLGNKYPKYKWNKKLWLWNFHNICTSLKFGKIFTEEVSNHCTTCCSDKISTHTTDSNKQKFD